MDDWLKALITAACVVVIGAGVYFAISEYRASVRRADATNDFELAARCDAVVAKLKSVKIISQTEQTTLTNCMFQGLVTENDLKP